LDAEETFPELVNGGFAPVPVFTKPPGRASLSVLALTEKSVWNGNEHSIMKSMVIKKSPLGILHWLLECSLFKHTAKPLFVEHERRGHKTPRNHSNES
jgi:hypothetical protein